MRNRVRCAKTVTAYLFVCRFDFDLRFRVFPILTCIKCPFIIARSESLYSDVKCSACECMNHIAFMQGRIPWWMLFFAVIRRNVQLVFRLFSMTNSYTSINSMLINCIRRHKYVICFLYCFSFASHHSIKVKRKTLR